MVSADTIRNIVGIVGNVLSFFLFISPAPTFYKIWKKRSVEGFKADPYIATLMNCMLWVFYGLPIVHPDSLLIVTINGIGLVLEIAYLFSFLVNSPRESRIKVLVWVGIEVVAMAAIVTGVLLGAETHKKRSLIAGILCIIFGICMYASPLTIIRKVIKTKSVEYMPFFLSLASFLNGVDWTIYGFIKFDYNVVVPNLAGALLGFVQLVVYIYFWRPAGKKGGAADLDNDDKTPEAKLPAVVSGGDVKPVELTTITVVDSK